MKKTIISFVTNLCLVISIVSCSSGSNSHKPADDSDQLKVDSSKAAASDTASIEHNIGQVYCCRNHNSQHCGTVREIDKLKTRYGCDF